MILVGCAAPNIDAKHDVRGAKMTGVEAGSITYSGPTGAYRVQLVSKATGEMFLVEHGSSQSLNLVEVFKDETPHPGLKRPGSPSAIALPIGAYEVKGWHISSGAANVASTAPTGAKVTPSDQAERDLPVIRSSFPALADVSITQTLNPAARLENLGGASSGRVDMPTFIPVSR